MEQNKIKTRSGIEVTRRIIYSGDGEKQLDLYRQISGGSFIDDVWLKKEISELKKMMPEGLEISEREQEIIEAFFVAKIVQDNQKSEELREKNSLENALQSFDDKELLKKLLKDDVAKTVEKIDGNCKYGGSNRKIKLIQMLLKMDVPPQLESLRKLVEERILKELKELKPSKFKHLKDDVVKALSEQEIGSDSRENKRKFSLEFRKALIDEFAIAQALSFKMITHCDILRDEWKGYFGKIADFDVKESYPYVKRLVHPETKLFFLEDAELWYNDEFKRKMDLLFQIMERSDFNLIWNAKLLADAYLMVIPVLTCISSKFRQRAFKLMENWQESGVFMYYLNSYEFKQMEDIYGLDENIDKAIDIFLERISFWKPVHRSDCEERPQHFDLSKMSDAEIILSYAKKITLPETFVLYCNKRKDDYADMVERFKAWDDMKEWAARDTLPF